MLELSYLDFRAFNSDTGKVTTLEDFLLTDDERTDFDSFNDGLAHFFTHFYGCAISQFTGYVDFEGKKIYDNDVVEFLTPYDLELDEEPEYHLITRLDHIFIARYSENSFYHLSRELYSINMLPDEFAIKLCGHNYTGEFI